MEFSVWRALLESRENWAEEGKRDERRGWTAGRWARTHEQPGLLAGRTTVRPPPHRTAATLRSTAAGRTGLHRYTAGWTIQHRGAARWSSLRCSAAGCAVPRWDAAGGAVLR